MLIRLYSQHFFNQPDSNDCLRNPPLANLTKHSFDKSVCRFHRATATATGIGYQTRGAGQWNHLRQYAIAEGRNCH